MPRISVIVPVYNVAAQIAEAVASLRAQSLADFEVLIVDDGSTDGSGDVAAAAAAGDPRFTIIRQPNAGLSGARNRGLDTARGDYVAFLDGDDYFDPRFLEVMLATLERDGTDWVACAVSLVYPDGTTVTHSAIHGEPEPGPARTLPMRDARSVARLFPSAWNKLYRRSLFDDLRYPEGSWYEDHEVFWSLAARGRPLSYCPEPLILHRRDRPGQITGADSDRAFEQLAVLDRLAALMRAGGLDNPEGGFAYLATRLIHERALVLRQRDRRARFLAAARAFLERHGCTFDPGADPEISRGLKLALEGEVPVSVVVLGAGGALGDTLQALDRQTMADFDLTVIAAPGDVLPEALPCGQPVRRMDPEGLTVAALARSLAGRSVVLLHETERLAPDGLLRLVSLIEGTGTQMAMAGFERDGQGYHDGWSDNTVVAAELPRLGFWGGSISLPPARALRLHPVLGNRIFARVMLAGLDLPLRAGVLDTQWLLLGAALGVDTMGYAAVPVVTVPDLPEPGPDMATLVARLGADPLPQDDRLPEGWQTVLFLRLTRFSVAQGRHRRRLWSLALWRMWRGRLPAMRDTWPDPETPLWVRLLLQPRRTVQRWRLHRTGQLAITAQTD